MGIQHRKTNRTHRLWRKHKDAARGEGPKKKHRRGRKPQRQPKNAPKAQREPTSGVYEAAPRPSEEVEGDRRAAPATAPTVRASDSEAGDSTSVYAPATPDRLPPDQLCLVIKRAPRVALVAPHRLRKSLGSFPQIFMPAQAWERFPVRKGLGSFAPKC